MLRSLANVLAGVFLFSLLAFGSRGEGHLRFSYANSKEKIAAALDIVREVASRL